MDGFGARLRGLRVDNSLTQKALAEILNVSIPTLSHWECDYQEPSFKDLANIGKKFDVSIDYLLGIDDFGAPIAAPMGASLYSSEERRLIEEYRKLPAESRKLVLRMVGITSTSQGAKKKA